MKAIITAVSCVVAFIVSLFFVYPFVFNLVSGLFENPDLGAIFGLVACFFVTGPILMVGMLVGAFLTALAATFD